MRHDGGRHIGIQDKLRSFLTFIVVDDKVKLASLQKIT